MYFIIMALCCVHFYGRRVSLLFDSLSLSFFARFSVCVYYSLEILLFHYVFSHFSSVPSCGTESSEEEDERERENGSSRNATKGAKQQHRGGIFMLLYGWIHSSRVYIKLHFSDPAQHCCCCSTLPYTLTFSIFFIPRGHLNTKNE